MESMKKENIYRTTVTSAPYSNRHVLKVWRNTRPGSESETPYKVHVSKDYGYILKMERDYLSRKITSIFP